MDLSSRYMGLDLAHPLMASASPLSMTLDGIRALEDAGVSGLVLFSLFEEQLQAEQDFDDLLQLYGDDSFAESLSFLPRHDHFSEAAEHYLELIRKAKDATSIPIIGSINGVTSDGWLHYAKQMEQAGADGLELHLYYHPPTLDISGREVEAHYIETARRVKQSVNIPVALKLDPYFSAFGNMAKQLDQTGVDALVMFNRLLMQDFRIDSLQIKSAPPYSHPGDIALPLHWIAVLYGKLKTSLAATTGVYCADDAIKYLLAGADSVMLASCLIKHGPEHVQTILSGIKQWMEVQGMESIDEMRGIMSESAVPNPEAFERLSYLSAMAAGKRA